MVILAETIGKFKVFFDALTGHSGVKKVTSRCLAYCYLRSGVYDNGRGERGYQKRINLIHSLVVSTMDAVALTQYSLLLIVNLLLSNKSSPDGSSNKYPSLHGS